MAVQRRPGSDPGARREWELRFALNRRGGPFRGSAWEAAVGVAWQLIGWVAEQTGTQSLTERFMDPAWRVDPDRFDPVLAVLAAAVLDQAWRHDTRPEQVTFDGIAASLTGPACLAHGPPVCDAPDDLWPLLTAAGDTQRQRWAALAREVLAAHIGDPPGRDSGGVGYRLEHCPVPGNPAGLLRAEDRRERDGYIDAATPAYLVTVTGPVMTGPGEVICCPGCGMSTGLWFSSEAGRNAVVTGRCANDHTWPVPHMSARHLGEILARTLPGQ